MFTPFTDTVREFLARAYPAGHPLLQTGNSFLEEGLSGGLYAGEMLLVTIPAPLRQSFLVDLLLKSTGPCAAVWLSGIDWRDAISRALVAKENGSINTDVLKNKELARASTSELIPLLEKHGGVFELIFIDGLCDTPETGFVLAALRKLMPNTAFVLGCQPGLSARQSGMPGGHFDCTIADKSLTISSLGDYDRPYVEASSWRTGQQSGAYIQVRPNLIW